ncbi:MAG: ArsR family transcriptional regulator [Promethearchaeota archaeon]|nr:MAG: ArsR family transcriptional regulator [Candidatus Lokiarchaeota archaeon]
MDWKNSSFSSEYRDLYSLPPSAKFVLYILTQKGSVCRKELIKQTLLSSRTVGHALRVLLDHGYIKKQKLKKRSRRHKVDKRIVVYCLDDTFN